MKKFVWFLVGVLSTISVTAVAQRAGFTDQDMFGDWYSDSVNEMVSIGVVEGYPDGSFQPGNNVNRAELTVMFDRFKDYVDARDAGEEYVVDLENDVKETYFAQGFEGEDYVAVNMNSGEVVDYIPEGYDIVAQWSYPTFPEYFILRKDNKLYRYTLVDESLDEIAIGELKDMEDVLLETSISNKDKIFLVIRDTVESSGMYGYEVVGLKQYFYDIAENSLEKADDLEVYGVDYYSHMGCSAYDSEYSRFFTWPCGEGIGSSIPLSAYYYEDETVEEIVGFDDFGISEDVGRIGVEQYENYFVMITKVADELDSIKVIDGNFEDPEIVNYTFEDDVLSGISERYSPYSALIVDEYNTIVIGGSSFVLFLRYDENNVINDYQYIEEPNIYANFIFTDGQKLYYRYGENVKIVDLENWVNLNTYVTKYLEGITLISM